MIVQVIGFAGLSVKEGILARIIHDFAPASLVLRLHRAFAALENTGSIPVGRRKPCEAETLRDPTPKS